jgi:hypothetical protein
MRFVQLWQRSDLVMSEGQTWRSEDTGVFSFKVLFGTGALLPFDYRRLHGTDGCHLSEAERIVFAPEGLLLAHDSPFN